MTTLISVLVGRVRGSVGIVVDDRHPIWSGFRSGVALGVVLIALLMGVLL